MKRRTLKFGWVLLWGGISATCGVVGQTTCLGAPPTGRPILVLDPGGHSSEVRGLAFTLDGKTLISSSRDNTIRFWDVATGALVRVLRLPTYGENNGKEAISPDGRLLAVSLRSPEEDHAIALIALPEGRIIRYLKGHSDAIWGLAFSPDGKKLASASKDASARIWNVDNGECEQALTGHRGPTTAVAFSPGGNQLATASYDWTARIWSVATGQCQTVLRDTEIKSYGISGIAWSPDGRTIVTGCMGSPLRVWSPDGTLRKRYRALGPPGSLRFTSDSKAVLYNGEHGAYLLELENGQNRAAFTLLKSDDYSCSAALSPDEKTAASGGRSGEELYLWNTADGQPLHHLAGPGCAAWGVGWSPDSKNVAWGDTVKKVVYRQPDALTTPHPLERSFRLADLDFGPAPDSTFRRCLSTLGGLSTEMNLHSRWVTVKDGNDSLCTLQTTLAFALTFVSGERIVVAGPPMNLYDARTGRRIRRVFRPFQFGSRLAPSPDNQYLLSSAGDQTLRIWKFDRQEPLLSLFFAGEQWIAWTPEGYYAASANGEKLMGWQVNNGPEQMATFYPASQFRKTFYRPDVIKRLLDEGSLEKALLAADKERGIRGEQTEVAKVMPPEVAITSPRGSGLRLTEASLQVEASARSTGSNPVTSLQLLLDGRPYQGQVSLKKMADRKLGETTASWEVELPPGTHRLAVKATSSVSDALSDECEVTLASGGPNTNKPHGRLFVLAVGINAYPGHLRLDCAAPDARALAAVFREHSQGLFTGVNVRLLVDQEATRRNILGGLAWLKTQVKPGDVAIAFYAGHGDARHAGQFYLLPVDVNIRDLAATGISGDQLKKELGALPCSTMLLLDACYAGSFDKPGLRKRSLPGAADDLVRDFVYDAGLVVMCGAAKEQEAAEENGRGFFTRALVEGLSGQATRDEMGVVDLSALQLYVERRVRKLSGGEQEPTISRPSTVRSFALAKP